MGYVYESAVSQNFRQAETLAIIYKICPEKWGQESPSRILKSLTFHKF